MGGADAGGGLKDESTRTGSTLFLSHTKSPLQTQTHQPFTGTYIPTQRLGFMHEGGDGTLASQGGSQGTWILRVEDPTLNGTKGDIALNGWTLRLCGKEAPVETIVDSTVGMTATVQSASLSSPTPSVEASPPQ